MRKIEILIGGGRLGIEHRLIFVGILGWVIRVVNLVNNTDFSVFYRSARFIDDFSHPDSIW